MPALFLHDLGQLHGSLTVSASLAVADRTRYISRGDLHEIVDGSPDISIDAESYLLGSDEIDGRSYGRNATRRTNF
jgi:hypothetical protein